MGKKKSKKQKSVTSVMADAINYTALIIIIVLIWIYVTNSGSVSTLLLPTITQVKDNFVDQLISGQLIGDICVSLKTVAEGFLMGAALGLILGIAMGTWSRVNKFFGFLFDAIRQIPGVAWFPLIILWFGIGDLSKVILVARGAFFPILVNTIEGIRSTDVKYMDLVKLYKVKFHDVILKIHAPSAIPFICSGLRLGASSAWIALVAAEMLGASSGLGYRIQNAQQMMRSDVMIVDILVIGILGWLIDLILRKATSLLIKWNRK